MSFCKGFAHHYFAQSELHTLFFHWALHSKSGRTRPRLFKIWTISTEIWQHEMEIGSETRPEVRLRRRPRPCTCTTQTLTPNLILEQKNNPKTISWPVFASGPVFVSAYCRLFLSHLCTHSLYLEQCAKAGHRAIKRECSHSVCETHNMYFNHRLNRLGPRVVKMPNVTVAFCKVPL